MPATAARLLLATAFLAFLPSCGLMQKGSNRPDLETRRKEMRKTNQGHLVPTVLPEGVVYSGGDNQTMGALFAADGDTFWFKSVNPDEGIASRRSVTLGFSATRHPNEQPSGEIISRGRISSLGQPYVITKAKGESTLTGRLPAQPVPGRVGLFLRGEVSFGEGISLEEAQRTMGSFVKP